MRMLALFYNALPVRWQRRILDRTQSRFLVGVVGLGVDTNGHVILARHRFGAPEWRFLGGAPRGRARPRGPRGDGDRGRSWPDPRGESGIPLAARRAGLRVPASRGR